GERMDAYAASVGGWYRSPYMYGSTGTFEPNAMGAIHDGSKVPDYNTFCLDCHQDQVPTTQSQAWPGRGGAGAPAGYLSRIKWGADGDKHGARYRSRTVDGSQGWEQILSPYNMIPVQPNYVLSCLDCHEPHGTVLNSGYLLRKEVNGNVVSGCGSGEGAWCQVNFCLSCHTHNHCGGAQGCFGCHYHGAVATGAGWCGNNTGHTF
ncbi:MAG: hypothetical protein V1736_09400, partial [Pseudomonadota bacterium]